MIFITGVRRAGEPLPFFSCKNRRLCLTSELGSNALETTIGEFG
jgi:hypothetical protein